MKDYEYLNDYNNIQMHYFLFLQILFLHLNLHQYHHFHQFYLIHFLNQGVDGRGVEGVAEGLVGGRPFVSLADFTEELGVDAALLVLGAERQGAGNRGEEEQCFLHDSMGYQLFWSKRGGGRSGSPPGRRRRPSRRCPTPSG